MASFNPQLLHPHGKRLEFQLGEEYFDVTRLLTFHGVYLASSVGTQGAVYRCPRNTGSQLPVPQGHREPTSGALETQGANCRYHRDRKPTAGNIETHGANYRCPRDTGNQLPVP